MGEGDVSYFIYPKRRASAHWETNLALSLSEGVWYLFLRASLLSPWGLEGTDVTGPHLPFFPQGRLAGTNVSQSGYGHICSQ